MFWSDPNLYSFAYKDINTPVQSPFLGPVYQPWQNLPRFLPTPYGFSPWNMPTIPNVPTMGFTPFNIQNIPPMGFTPFNVPNVPPMGFTPFNVPNVPPMGFNPLLHTAGFNPYFQPQNVNLPLYNLFRPFTC